MSSKGPQRRANQRQSRAEVVDISKSNDSSNVVVIKQELSEPEPEESDSEKTENLTDSCAIPEMFTNGTETGFKCLICNQRTTDRGVTVEVYKLFPKFADEDDYVVIFLLRKLLQVPADRLVEYLVLFGSPKDWVTSCKTCEFVISKGYQPERGKEKMKAKLKILRTTLTNKIKSSWDREGNQSKVGSSFDVYLEPVREHVRGFVATGSWAELNSGIAIADPEDLIVAVSKKRNTKTDNCESRLRTALKRQRKPKAVAYHECSDDNEWSTLNEVEESFSEQDEKIPTKTTKRKVSEGCTKRKRFNQPSSSGLVHHKGASKLMEEEIYTTNLPVSADNDIVNSVSNFSTDDDFIGSETLYNCHLCPNLNSMKLQPFVMHIHYHKLRPYKCRICGNYYTEGARELKVQPVKNLNLINTASPGSLLPSDHKCELHTLDLTEFTPGRIWQCSTCTETFDSPQLRNAHELSHDDPGELSSFKFTCSMCPEPLKLRNYDEWRIHRGNAHPNHSMFACVYCDKSFEIRNEGNVFLARLHKFGLNRHLTECHKSLPKLSQYSFTMYFCEFCGETFETMKLMISHTRQKHGLGEDFQPFLCLECLKRKPSLTILMKHIDKVHGLGVDKSTSSNDLRIKANRKEKQTTPVEATTKLEHCTLCDNKSWKSRQWFVQHMFTKHGIHPGEGKLYECTEDGCTFKTTVIGLVKPHRIRCHGQKREHICTVCGKAFMNTLQLHDHELIHSDARAYQCDICGKSFKTNKSLYIHKRWLHERKKFPSSYKRKFPERPFIRKGVNYQSINSMDIDNGQQQCGYGDSSNSAME